MKDEDKLIRAYTGSEILVNILKDKLEQNGISVTIRNDSGDSFLMGTPTAIDLLIQQADLKKAEPLIRDFINNN